MGVVWGVRTRGGAYIRLLLVLNLVRSEVQLYGWQYSY